MPSEFGDLMKEYRKKKKMTLDDLAAKVNSSKQVLSRYERGERVPKISAAQKIADALDVPLELLIGYEYHEPDPWADLQMYAENVDKPKRMYATDSMPLQMRTDSSEQKEEEYTPSDRAKVIQALAAFAKKDTEASAIILEALMNQGFFSRK